VEKRLLQVPADDEQVLRGFSRAPHHPPPRLDSQVVDRLLEIRDDPPEDLGRTPGPKAILYYLNRDEALKEQGLRLPQSPRTVHRLLHENGRIASRLPTFTDPTERPPPMQHWQRDFKDASAGRGSIHMAKNNMWWKRSISSTKALRSWWLIMFATILQQRPRRTNVRRAGITFLHYAGPGHTLGGLSAISSDFPAALVRFCHSSGVAVLICDPHHPNKMALSNDQPTLPSFRFWTAEFNPHPVIQSRSFRSIPYAVSRPLLSCSFLGEILVCLRHQPAPGTRRLMYTPVASFPVQFARAGCAPLDRITRDPRH
jgi:hypothetical protein